MIKLLSIKPLGNLYFELSVSHNGIKKKIIIVQHEILIEEVNETLTYLNTDDKDFYDVWGQSFDFRQEVSKKIKQLKEAEITELQLA